MARRLLQVHDRRPFAQTSEEIAALAAEVRDGNFRIATAADGIHAYSRRLHQIGHDAFGFFPALDVAQ